MKSSRSLTIWLLLPVVVWAEPCSDESQREAYGLIATLDQQPRIRLAEWLTKHGGTKGDPELAEIQEDMQRTDVRVRGLLTTLWDQCGRPANAALSKENIGAILLVALHGDLEIQSRLIEFLREAAGRGLVGSKQMATLEERFKKQQMGSGIVRPGNPPPPST